MLTNALSFIWIYFPNTGTLLEGEYRIAMLLLGHSRNEEYRMKAPIIGRELKAFWQNTSWINAQRKYSIPSNNATSGRRCYIKV